MKVKEFVEDWVKNFKSKEDSGNISAQKEPPKELKKEGEEIKKKISGKTIREIYKRIKDKEEKRLKNKLAKKARRLNRGKK